MIDPMDEVKEAERFIVTAYGRISLVNQDHPDARLETVRDQLSQAVVKLHEGMDCQTPE